jgi:hypothetical protein
MWTLECEGDLFGGMISSLYTVGFIYKLTLRREEVMVAPRQEVPVW